MCVFFCFFGAERLDLGGGRHTAIVLFFWQVVLEPFVAVHNFIGLPESGDKERQKPSTKYVLEYKVHCMHQIKDVALQP